MRARSLRRSVPPSTRSTRCPCALRETMMFSSLRSPCAMPRSCSAASGFAADHLEDHRLPAVIRAVDDARAAFSDAANDNERAYQGAGLERLVGGESTLTQVAQALIGVGARSDDRFDERVECVDLP